jgi:hypothetical protein
VLIAQPAHLVDLRPNTEGYAINNTVEVAFSGGIYHNGSITTLPKVVLPYSYYPPEPAIPLAINANGGVAGYFQDGLGEDGLVYANGVMTTLSGFFPYTGLGSTALTQSIRVAWLLVIMTRGPRQTTLAISTTTAPSRALGHFPVVGYHSRNGNDRAGNQRRRPDNGKLGLLGQR